MTRVLMDSGPFLALLDAGDSNHRLAAAYARSLRDAAFIVPATVFVETMVLVKSRLGAKAAIDLGEAIRAGGRYRIVELTTEDRDATWTIFSTYADKDWSYVDCSLLALARRLGVTVVFSFDHHIGQMAEISRVPVL
jgi:predicted nucleic acid-binding protein